MFLCTTELRCDNCGTGYSSEGARMSCCTSKAWFEIIVKDIGWKVIYGKYHICKDCIEHYGMKYLRAKFKEA